MRSEESALLIDLAPLFNNDSISYASNLGDGGFNVWDNSFPAEELPASLSVVSVGGIPFRFPPKEDGRLNTVVCCGQRLDLPPGSYDWLYVLVAAERRTEDSVFLHYADGAVDSEWLRISDFWPGAGPRFGEIVAFRCAHMHYPRHVQPRVEPVIWRQRIPVTREQPLAWVHLPDNVAIHLFAMTVIRSMERDQR